MKPYPGNRLAFLPPSPLHYNIPSRHHHAPCNCPRLQLRACNTSEASRRNFLRAITFSPLAYILSPSTPTQARPHGLPPGTAEAIIADVQWPPTWPYNPADFRRFDETTDDNFYTAPRLVRHIDEDAVSTLKKYYANNLLPNTRDVLDICSSIEAYMPASGWSTRRRVAGLGMNEVELSRNDTLTEYCVRDLNVNPKLPYADNQFDLVLCAMSIDYLTHPKEILQESARVLRPGGKVALSFSDRVFGTKAVSVWMAGGDQDHIYTAASFIHYAGGFEEPHVVDLSPRKNGACTGDPLYLVSAVKQG